jgi:hypothetical protein
VTTDADSREAFEILINGAARASGGRDRSSFYKRFKRRVDQLSTLRSKKSTQMASA